MERKLLLVLGALIILCIVVTLTGNNVPEPWRYGVIVFEVIVAGSVVGGFWPKN